MKESIASAPAAVWNRKNLPSNIERLPHRSGGSANFLKQMPGALTGFARQQPGILMLSLAAVAALGLIWYFAKGD